MIKLIKRLVLFSIATLIAGGIWGYKNGMTIDNYQAFLSETFSTNPQLASTPDIAIQRTKKSSTSNTEKKNLTNQELQALLENPFSAIDTYARKAPASSTTAIETLANYLSKKATTDLEKARAIYSWMTDNISYDDDAFNSGNYPVYSAEYVLQNRKAVCEGYSNLFVALGEEMDLEVEKIVGYSKGYNYVPGKQLKESDHAWNAVKINGNWKIMDATWGSGSGENVNGKLVSKKEFDNYWFDVDPYEAIFNHFPEDKENAFIQPLISLNQYEQMPLIEKGYFELGFNGKETFLSVQDNPNLTFPKIYSFETPIKLIAAPKFKELKMEESYYFECYIPKGLNVAAISVNNEWTHFKKTDGKFTLDFAPTETGVLKIAVQHEDSGEQFSTILKYIVVRNKGTM
ncbi:MAG: transglutaminase domain-containing protein [Saprospiraceae bacterium]